MSHAVVGVVTDNVDPERLGRIRVKFPTLNQAPESFWLRHISQNAGKERGMYSLPEIDDEVLVLFLQGDHDTGVIIGQFWNGVDKPPKEAMAGMPGSGKTDTGGKWSTAKFSDGATDIEKNDRRFWRSRSGHIIALDDTDGKETVQVWDKSHTLSFVFDTKDSRILLTNSKGDIHIRTKQDLYLDAGRDIKYIAGRNVEGEAGTDIKTKAGANYKHESGTNTEMKSGANTKVSAGANLEMSASAKASLSASMTELSGSAMLKVDGGGMTSVKGGLVTIN